ncbi:MAG: hypothetical protein ACXWSC_21515 [Bdellovibrionota bacterium]
MAEEYKRGQVASSIWRAFTLRDEPVPAAFNAKIKKLAQLDVPLTEAERSGQPGIDNLYTPYQAFELGVALKMVDAGFKQGEVAIFVKHVRPNLRRAYSEILNNPPAISMNVLAKDRPNSPRRMVVREGSMEPTDHPLSADTSYWMTVRSLEFPQILHPRAKKGELHFEPQFHPQFESLVSHLEKLSQTYGDDHRFVLELSNLAMLIINTLRQIQPTQRGRQ